MKIRIIKKKTKAVNEFLDREWKIANIERFGKNEWVENEGRIIAEDQEEIVGSLQFHYRAGVMEIVALIIAHQRQRQGIGTLLMKKIEAMAIRKGAHKMYLITGFGERAVKFYKSLGYKETGIVKNHYRKVDMTELSKIIPQR